MTDRRVADPLTLAHAHRASDAGHTPLDRRFTLAVLDNVIDMVAACDAKGAITIMNRAMADAIGATAVPHGPPTWMAEWVQRQPGGATLRQRDLPLNRALRGETVTDEELEVTTSRHGRRRVRVNAEPVVDDRGQLAGAVLVMRDVTRERTAEEMLAFQAMHDKVTGLPNRVLFVDHARSALSRAARHRWSTGFLVINVVAFEAINARLGYEAGDQVLAEIARRLQSATRSADRVARPEAVGRLGGDEFLMLCEHVGGAPGAANVASRVAALCAEPILLGSEMVRASVRVGIAVTTGSPVDPEVMIREATSALRRLRATGGSGFAFYDETMRSAQMARFADELALRSALERDELRLVFQPKVALDTDRITGFEALIRWLHPERGVIPPTKFIPLAEETGLIIPIGHWVLRQACEAAARWAREYPSPPVSTMSVNLSARQFDNGLVQTLQTVLAETGLDPRLLCLEVTESMVMGDPEMATTMLHQIKELGVHVSIDDFGTGYSSLAYLRRFPLTELKIDKSFVDGLGRDPESTAIVAAVMGMAHAMDLSVVAEGVETSAQLSALRALGCDEAQGYYYARPLPAGEIDRLLAAPHLESEHRRGLHGRADARSSGTIVIADDAADVRLLSRVSLTASGFEVHEAENGEDAIDLVHLVRPDCIVLDMYMPGMSGLDVCRALRADSATRDLTVVMLTADGSSAEKAEAFSLEVDDYIVKPFAPRDLVSRTTVAIRRRAETQRSTTV